MQVEVNIEFEQLVKIAKTLPAKQWSKLKKEVETKVKGETPENDLATLLLNGPVATKKQLQAIEKTRKEINQWRTK
jgi:hypothetical protein